MKYLIDEKRLNKVIYKYIDDLFSNIDFKSLNPEFDYQDSPRNILFYNLDSQAEEEYIFYWYSKDYFDTPPPNIKLPLVELEYRYKNELNNFFGTLWHKPFMKWFKKKFNMEVKSVE